MIYKTRMTSMEDCKHNFMILKLVKMLWRLQVIDNDEVVKHIEAIDNGKPMGLYVNYVTYEVGVGPNETYQF